MARRYLIALGSNMRHHRHGRPERVLAAALTALAGEDGLEIERVSPIVGTRPLGHSRRRFANAAAIIAAPCGPDGLLAILQRIEQNFGRRRGGRRWSARVLDLDIVLWDGGAFAEGGLVVPHVAFRSRGFVLGPALAIAPAWRDPISGLTIRQLHTRLTRPRSVPR